MIEWVEAESGVGQWAQLDGWDADTWVNEEGAWVWRVVATSVISETPECWDTGTARGRAGARRAAGIALKAASAAGWAPIEW